MKILHIMAGKGLGGAETYSADVMLSLHTAGLEQIVVMSKRAPRFAEIRDAGIRVAPWVLAIPLRPLQKILMRILVAREKPSIIHCWMRRAASLTPRTKQPTIGWFGGYYDPDNFRKCGYFVGVTKDIVAHMVREGVPTSRATFIPTFPDIVDEPAVTRSSLNTPAESIVLLALSRLHPKKGLDTLLTALRDLPGCIAWLAGEGPDRRKLENLAKELGVWERVRFLGWRTDRSALLKAATLCVLPSRYEPFGTVILEAWAAKVPLVACSSAGPRLHITDGTNGVLCPIDDPTSLTSAIRRTIGDPALRTKLIQNGYTTYQTIYTREAVTAAWMAYYKKLFDETTL